MSPASDWQRLNLQMIAKSLQELSFEQVLAAVRLDKTPESEMGRYQLDLANGVQYRFRAWRGIWTDLKVAAESIRRNDDVPVSAGQFFIDTQKETGMDDIILANFLEEMHNSLYADQAVLAKARLASAAEVAAWSGEKIQSVLKGHPKLLNSKGRVGFSAEDQDLYGPEQEHPIRFQWLAVRKDLCVAGFAPDKNLQDILQESLNAEEFARLQACLENKNLGDDTFYVIPVHPWQWDRYIKIQFAAELAIGDMHLLGVFGDAYLPQISLRTFTNASRPEKMDIKLPLTILNTSAIRGIPAKYMAQGPRLSADLTALCKQDPVLQNTSVLEEKAGVSVQHRLYNQIKTAPYRYHEFLGVIWRQSPTSHLRPNQQAILAGSLFHRDEKGDSLIGAIIGRSGLSIEQWLKRYFEQVVIPLYHLQSKYGLGLVAHGQNVVVKLENSVPVGLLLKDFQGDLRMTTESTALQHDLTRLPAHYLIHDLLTGHFVTVLRFISETLKECDGFSEQSFYFVLGQVLKAYREAHPEMAALPYFKDINLLQPEFKRVLVNKVRFKIGYADSAERPVPMLGDDLRNPIYLSLYADEVQSMTQHYNLIGIGIGLFNLSLAALVQKTPGVRSIFFDRKHRFDWHTEISFADSEMQTSYLKDLVTPADPTNAHSFMNYLVQKGLFYSFLNTNRKTITRREFEMYCQWVSENLKDQLRFDSDIQSVDYNGQHFILQVNGTTYTADHICIGTGLVPQIPVFAEKFEGPEVFHAKSSYLKVLDASNKDVVVVGGGQTGLEIFRNCLQAKWGPPKSLKMISSRPNLEPLDNSPFVNEYFAPGYVHEFLQLDQSMKDPIVKYQKLASDGNTPEYLDTLYKDLYQFKHVWGDTREVQILPFRRVVDMKKSQDRYDLRVRNGFTQQTENTPADIVILSTGFKVNIPALIEPLRPMIDFDAEGRFKLDRNFNVAWQGSGKNKIYAMNFSRHGHGIAEPQTSLMAWRSATIVNDLTQEQIFPIKNTVANFVTYT